MRRGYGTAREFCIFAATNSLHANLPPRAGGTHDADAPEASKDVRSCVAVGFSGHAWLQCPVRLPLFATRLQEWSQFRIRFCELRDQCSRQVAIDRFSCLFEVSWSQKRRGLQENIEYYRNTALMSPDMPDSFKPILLVNGFRVDFPGVGCENQGHSACIPIKLQDALP